MRSSTVHHVPAARSALAGERTTGRTALVTALVSGLVGGLAGCGTGPPAEPAPPSSQPIPAQGAREQLAGRAAAAKDRRYVGTYTLTAKGRPARTVTVAVATDSTWVVSVPGGALGGYADIAIYRAKDALYHCALGPSAAAPTPPPGATPPVVAPGCVKVDQLVPAVDPRIHRVFTDWIEPLVDRQTAISVAPAAQLAGTTGSCFSIEPNSAALAPPVDPGIYCYATDGTLTGLRTAANTLVLAAPPGDGPPTIALPAPIVGGSPLPLAAPPPPPTATPFSPSPGQSSSPGLSSSPGTAGRTTVRPPALGGPTFAAAR